MPPRAPSSQRLEPQILAGAGDCHLPGGNALPSLSVERLRREAHAFFEGGPAQRRGTKPSRPAHADELFSVAEQQGGDRRAVEAFADRLEPPDGVAHRFDERPTRVEDHREDMFGVAAALNRFVRLRSEPFTRSEEHTSELQSRLHLVCRLLLEKKKERSFMNSTTSPTRAECQ